ncbi:MAG: hypothetical protein ABSG68_11860 [Thermoguttaceae bacterium]|jgi:hypothetical protein
MWRAISSWLFAVAGYCFKQIGQFDQASFQTMMSWSAIMWLFAMIFGLWALALRRPAR